MKKLTLSLSPFPPFASVKLDIPIDALVEGLFKHSPEPFHVGELVLWCLKQILSDQFAEGDVAGAWSRRYEGYMHFVYGGEDKTPHDMAIKDSISYSGLISDALNRYRKKYPNEPLSKVILGRLQLLEAYLRRHYDPLQGGFGLTRMTSRNEREVAVDLRHTIWAVLTLWELAKHDSRTNDVMRKVGAYLNNRLKSLDPEVERGITFAVCHRLLTTAGASDVFILPEASRAAYIRRLEDFLIGKFDDSYGSWDLDRDPPDTLGTDNALFILSTVMMDKCLEQRCLDMFRVAVERLCAFVIEVDEEKAGLAFVEGGAPDIGSTLNLLWILRRDKNFLSDNRKIIRKMLNFVVDPVNRQSPGPFAYPWHLASALSLICIE